MRGICGTLYSWSADVFGKLFYGKEPEEARAAIEKIKAEGIRRWGKCP